MSAFKKLHRTGQMIFQGDPHALTECRTKINSEFRDRINIKDQAELEKVMSIISAVTLEFMYRLHNKQLNELYLMAFHSDCIHLFSVKKHFKCSLILVLQYSHKFLIGSIIMATE